MIEHQKQNNCKNLIVSMQSLYLLYLYVDLLPIDYGQHETKRDVPKAAYIYMYYDK